MPNPYQDYMSELPIGRGIKGLENTALAVRAFYAPHGVMFDDGETLEAGWYIQITGNMCSDGIGPYGTLEEALAQIPNEFDTILPFKDNSEEFTAWVASLPKDGEPIHTPGDSY